MLTESRRVGAQTPPRRSTAAALAVGFGILGALISVTGSWVPSLWGDEAATQLSARRSLPELFHLVQRVDAVHGTYYLFLHGWIAVFGYAPFAIRFPSCVGAGACVGLVVWLCLRLSTRRVAVLAGIVCSVLPRLTYAGAEARSFSFDAAFAAALCVIAVEIARRPGKRRGLWVLYAVVLTAATYLFLYTGLVTVAVGGWLAVSPGLRHLWKRWLLASGAAFVAALPLIVTGFLERAQIGYLKTGNYASWDVILKQLWFGDTRFAWAGWMLMLVAAVHVALRLRHPTRSPPDLALFALSWVIVPMGLLLAGNAVYPLFTARYAAVSAPAVAVVMALGVDGIAAAAGRLLPRRVVSASVAVVVSVAVIALAAPTWASQRGPYSQNQSDWNQIAHTVHAGARPGDAIVFDASARVSRRPRLAYDTAEPGAFGPVRDVLLKTSFRADYTWYAATYSVSVAARKGRLAAADRVWVVEYRTPQGLSGPHRPDTYGLAGLRRLGFRTSAIYPLHASTIYLMTRTP